MSITHRIGETMPAGYADIAAHYRRLIQDGQLAPGDPMPSLADVMKAWAVARTTANRAWRELQSEGLIEAKVGVGTIVAVPRSAVGGADRVDRLARTGTPYAHGETSNGHRVYTRSVNDPDICQALAIDGDDEVVIRVRTFHRDGKPHIHAVTVIPVRIAAVVPEITQPGQILNGGGWWMDLYTQRTGREVSRSPERRTARLAADYELEALGLTLPAGSAVPVLVTHTLFHDETGPVCLFEDTYAPGTWQTSG